MNITASKRDLLHVATRALGVVERKSTMPVLANVLLHANQGRLTVSATDLYLSLVGWIGADVAVTGSVAVSAKDLVDRVKMMPDGPISLSTKDSSLTLKSTGTARKFTMRGMSGDDYPPLPKADAEAPTLHVEAATLSKLIALTQFSISTDETRAHLNSLLVEWDGDVLRAVSTDGHRLSKAEAKLEGQSASTSLLIPLKAIRIVKEMCDGVYAAPTADGAKPSIKIERNGGTAFFVAGDTTFSVKLVDAQFPPYAQVIPAKSERTIRLPRALLADALKAVAIASNERTGGVKFSFAKGVLTLTSESADTGDGRDELPYDVVDGKDGALFGVNAKYILDVLGAISDDEITIGLTGELDPAVIRPASGSDYLAVVMPMRI